MAESRSKMCISVMATNSFLHTLDKIGDEQFAIIVCQYMKAHRFFLIIMPVDSNIVRKRTLYSVRSIT